MTIRIILTALFLILLNAPLSRADDSWARMQEEQTLKDRLRDEGLRHQEEIEQLQRENEAQKRAFDRQERDYERAISLTPKETYKPVLIDRIDHNE